MSPQSDVDRRMCRSTTACTFLNNAFECFPFVMGGVGAGAGQQQSTASSAAAASSRLQRETAVREMDCVCVSARQTRVAWVLNSAAFRQWRAREACVCEYVSE